MFLILRFVESRNVVTQVLIRVRAKIPIPTGNFMITFVLYNQRWIECHDVRRASRGTIHDLKQVGIISETRIIMNSVGSGKEITDKGHPRVIKYVISGLILCSGKSLSISVVCKKEVS